MGKNKDMMQQILDIGIALTAEKNPDKLLYFIVDTAMNLTGSDGGTLYILKDNALIFKIMKTKSKNIDMGREGETINIPPVELKRENICAYSAINKAALNIEDVYESDLFDFSGPKKYDEINGYRTKSMVAIPMISNEDEVIGVMQLINAMDDNGEIRSYTKEEERILMALSSQTAIALSNMAYLDEISKQMWSFTEAMTEVIDARTPYNGSHTRKVAEYVGIIADYINMLHDRGEEELYFTKDHRDQLVMAAYLHDIGKMVIPTEIMNKQTRLGKRLSDVEGRIEKISLLLQIDYLKNQISEEIYNEMVKRLDDTLEIVKTVNGVGFLNDSLIESLNPIFEYVYNSPDGKLSIPFITDDEKECLSIVRGTLTPEERKNMESHVVMTDRILKKVYFNKSFRMAPIWASQHHECINGTGYPNGIEGDAFCTEARIIAVADICDALMATDRPYKKPLPMDKAFSIMQNMVEEGKLDGRFVQYLCASLKK